MSPRTEKEPTRRDNNVEVKSSTLHSRGSGALSGNFQHLFSHFFPSSLGTDGWCCRRRGAKLKETSVPPGIWLLLLVLPFNICHYPNLDLICFKTTVWSDTSSFQLTESIPYLFRLVAVAEPTGGFRLYWHEADVPSPTCVVSFC